MTKHTYTVKKGDSLWRIARDHGTTVPELLALNPQIHDADLIYPDQKITLPVKPSVPPPLPPLEEKSSSAFWWVTGGLAVLGGLAALIFSQGD